MTCHKRMRAESIFRARAGRRSLAGLMDYRKSMAKRTDATSRRIIADIDRLVPIAYELSRSADSLTMRRPPGSGGLAASVRLGRLERVVVRWTAFLGLVSTALKVLWSDFSHIWQQLLTAVQIAGTIR